jgi:hypothetical protein
MLARLTHRLPYLGMVVVRLGCHGRDERLSLGAQLHALAPAMECFRRHSHLQLPSHRAEMACSFLLKKSILEMRQKCDRFQAFLSVSPIFLGVRAAASDAASSLQDVYYACVTFLSIERLFQSMLLLCRICFEDNAGLPDQACHGNAMCKCEHWTRAFVPVFECSEARDD